MAKDDIFLLDGQMDWAGGVDGGRPTSIRTAANPNGLARNMLAWLQNGTCRGGSIRPRTRWFRRVSMESLGELAQGGFLYEPEGANPYLILSFGGRILKVDPDTGQVTDLSAAFGLSNPADIEKAYFAQGNKFLVIQAGDYGLVPNPTLPLFWDGVTLRRSKGITNKSVTPGTPGVNELPAATAMVYYQDRLWYAQGRQVSAGDISQGKSGTLANNFTDSILNVTENPLCVGGDGFSVPTEAGIIRALAYTANVDTNLGQGPLYIFTRKQVYSLVVPVTRADWIAATSNNKPSMTVAQVRYGSVSDRSLVHSNGDLYYQTMEPGIRSLILAIRYYTQFGNTPISGNVNRAIALNDRRLLHMASGIQFDNRIWQTCMPIQTPVGVGHQGLVALDFDLLSSFQDKLAESAVPAWEGMLETGIILQLWEGDYGGLERAFALMWFEKTNTLEIWEATNFAKFDQDDARVRWRVETPAYNWNSPMGRKIFETVHLWLDEIYGTVDFQVWFREDGTHCWHDWCAFRVCTARDSTEAGVPSYPPVIYCPDGQIPIALPKVPGFDCNIMSKRPVNIGYQFQVRIEIRGWCQIRGILAFAQPKEASLYENMVCAPSLLPKK